MADVNVSLGVTGKDVVLGAFSEVGAAGKAMGETFSGIAGKLAGLAAGYLSVSTAIGLFNKTLTEGGRLSDFSDQTGIAADKLVLLEQAFRNNGMQAEDLGMTINKMQKYLVEAGDSGSEAAYHIAGLGLSMADLQKMSPDQQFEAIGKAIAGISDPSERSAAAMGIFGKSGARLMAFFNDFNGSIETAKQEVGSYADLMGEKSRAFDELGDSISSIGESFGRFTAGLIDDSLPIFQQLADQLKKLDASDAGKSFGETFRKGVLTAVSVGIDPGNLFLAYGDTILGLLTKVENAFHNSIRYIGDFMMTAFKSLASSLGDMMSVALKLPAMQFLDIIAAGLANIAAIMPGTMSKAIGNAAANLQNTTKRMQLDIEAAQERASNFTMKALTAAYEKTTYKNTDYYNEKENFDSAAKRLSDNQAASESALGNKTPAEKKPNNPSSSSAAGSATGGGSSGAESGGAGGASWKAKMAPIIDPASINTGLYKNTQNSPLGFQADLAAASVGVQKNSKMKSLESQIQESSSGYSPSSLASLLQRKAELQQQLQIQGLNQASENQAQRDYKSQLGLSDSANQQDILSGLSRKYSNQGFGLFEAKKLAEKDYSAGVNKYKGNLSGSINKTGGPNGNGTSSSPSGGGGSSSDPMAGIQTLVKNIYDYMKQSLPQHALS